MIVVDTNVLVSGLINPKGVPGRIVALVAEGRTRLAFDDRIWNEYKEVLPRPKFDLDPSLIRLLLIQIAKRGMRVAAWPLPESLPDPRDDKFLEVAVASGAEHLVTGNLKHFPTRLREGVVVVSPREWFDHFKGND